MYLSKIYIKNFRGIKELLVEFDKKLNVIIGANGQLKTSLMDAIRLFYAWGEPNRDIEITKETTKWCSGGIMQLKFNFNDEITKDFYFECENLIYDNIHYELKDDVILFNKDVYIPDKITKGMIIVSNKDKIECK